MLSLPILDGLHVSKSCDLFYCKWQSVINKTVCNEPHRSGDQWFCLCRRPHQFKGKVLQCRHLLGLDHQSGSSEFWPVFQNDVAERFIAFCLLFVLLPFLVSVHIFVCWVSWMVIVVQWRVITVYKWRHITVECTSEGVLLLSEVPSRCTSEGHRMFDIQSTAELLFWHFMLFID
jgi:hypothetical protein